MQIPEGDFNLAGTLVIPAKVRVAGAGIDRTVLVSPSDPAAPVDSACTRSRPEVWLSGDGASIASLTVSRQPANRPRHRGSQPAAFSGSAIAG